MSAALDVQCSKCSNSHANWFTFRGQSMTRLCDACAHPLAYPVYSLPLFEVCNHDQHSFSSMYQLTCDSQRFFHLLISLEDQLHSMLLPHLKGPVLKQQQTQRHSQLSACLQNCASALQDFSCWKQPLSPLTHLVIKPQQTTDFALIQVVAHDPWLLFQLALSEFRPAERVVVAVRWLACQHWPHITAKLAEISSEMPSQAAKTVVKWAETHLWEDLRKFEGVESEQPYFLRDLRLPSPSLPTISWKSGLTALLSNALLRQWPLNEQTHEIQSLPALEQLLAISVLLTPAISKHLAALALDYSRWKARPGLDMQHLALLATLLLQSNEELVKLAAVFRALQMRSKEEAVLVRCCESPAELSRLRAIYDSEE